MTNVYGEWLRAQREAAGLTQQELADVAIMTRSHIAHIEAGRRIPSQEDARRLDRALGTGDVLQSFLPRQDDTIADYFEPARQLEQQATMIREFASAFVPGILQTKGYARAVLGTTFPPRSDEERDRHVVTRIERSQVLADPVAPVVWALLDEMVLRRPVGGREVMAEQIRHIIQLVESRRVRVHILPVSLGAHPLMQGMLDVVRGPATDRVQRRGLSGEVARLPVRGPAPTGRLRSGAGRRTALTRVTGPDAGDRGGTRRP